MKDYIEGSMPIELFEEFYKKNRLGNIYFPNGTIESPGDSLYGHNKGAFYTPLRNIYDIISRCNIDDDPIQELGLVGIIAVGDTVHYPGYIFEEHTRKRWLFGSRTWTVQKKIPVKPKKSEFLILTEQKPVPEEYISNTDPINEKCTFDEVNIKLYIRSLDQAINGIKIINDTSYFWDMESRKDNISINAFQEGVPIFLTHKRGQNMFEQYLKMSGIKRDTPRNIEWFKNGKQWNARVK